LWINECSDIGDAERTEQFLALGRRKPVSFVLNVMESSYGGHPVSFDESIYRKYRTCAARKTAVSNTTR
jgi:hypothetical protein